jgi:tape measure domain-containing protein
MPSKTVSPVDIVLKVSGSEKLQKLNSSFRDLSKQLNKLSAGDLQKATDDVRKFAAEAGNSEATIKGQIKAFEGLREQAAMGGKVYRELGKGIVDLKASLDGLGAKSQAQAKRLAEIGTSAKSSVSQIKDATEKLKLLSKEARTGSDAFARLKGNIVDMGEALELAEAKAKKQKEISNLLNGTLRKSSTLIGLQAKAYRERIAVTEKEIQSIDLLSSKERSTAANTEKRIRLEEKLQGQLLKVAQTGYLEFVASSRSETIKLAEAFSNTDKSIASFGVRLKALDQDFGKLPNTTAGLNQKLAELKIELNNTVRSSSDYTRVSNEIIGIQKELARETGESAQAFERLNRAQEGAERRAAKLQGIGDYVASMSGLGVRGGYASSVSGLSAEAAAGRIARGGTPVIGQMRSRQGRPQGYRDPASGAMIAPGVGTFASRRAFRRAGATAYDRPISPKLPPAMVEAREARKKEIEDRINNLKKINAENGALRQQAAIRRSIEKNQRKVAAKAPREQPMREISALYGQIGEIGISKIATNIDMMGKSYEEVSADIRAATAASNGSISSLEKQRNVWTQLRNGLDPASDAFRKVTKDIEKVDRALEKTSRSRRKFSPGKAAQVAGATISGGIFGGPEGFLGGAIGGAVGGVGGSFAGAALGAQVGQLRQQLGGFAEYAASIEKLKIALNGIAGDASNYNRALQAAADVTKELNIPQEVAIRGITRLTAAVKGAGGGVADAELAFKNINSAIIATGGGAEQVEGAVTALVQIFSKGKVSAEEINQIAERLPGTFNKIAEASGRTGPELTKALQKGEVGLNDLMKFLVQLGGEYGELAEKIAGSSESAGARLTVAYNNMRIEIGKALQPVGAEFQQAFGEFLEEITPAILAALPSIRDGLIALAKNLDLVAQAAAAAFAVFAVGKIAAIVASIGSLSKAVSALAANAVIAKKALIGLNGAALLNPYVALAAGAAALAIAINRAAKEQNRLNLLLREGSVAAVDKEIAENSAAVARIEQKDLKGSSTISGQIGEFLAKPILDPLREAQLTQLGETGKKLREARKRAVYDRDQGADLPDYLLNNLTDFASPTGTDTGGGGGGGGGGGKAEKVRKSLLDSIINEGKLIAATKARLDNEIDIGEAQNKNNRSRVNQLNNQRISIDFAEQAAQVELKYLEALKAAEGQKEQGALVAEAIATKQNDDARLSIEYAAELTKEAQRYRFEKEAIAKASEDELFNLRDQLGLVTNEQRIERFRQSRRDAGDPNAEQQTDLFRQTIDPTLTEGLSQNIRSLKKELEDLVNPINQITGAANAIGSAFSQSFTDAISGSKSAKEALADFFKSVGSYFLDMAGQIIAKMVTMAILNQVVKILPGSASAPSFGSGVDSGLPLFGDYSGLSGTPFEKGGVLADNEIVPFAKGGIVGEPTIFPLANGTGLMGEAGPEAIMPLKRGPSGRLGVEVASTREQLNNQQAATSTREQLDRQRAVASTREQLNNQQAKAMQPLDIRYESTVINNVEYVTAEQHRQGMAQAAERGRSLTLSALQGSVKTRKKVGLS